MGRRVGFTWSNNRVGDERREARLDRGYGNEEGCWLGFANVRTLNEGCVFDHIIVCFSFNPNNFKCKNTFKLNASLLKDKEAQKITKFT